MCTTQLLGFLGLEPFGPSALTATLRTKQKHKRGAIYQILREPHSIWLIWRASDAFKGPSTLHCPQCLGPRSLRQIAADARAVYSEKLQWTGRGSLGSEWYKMHVHVYIYIYVVCIYNPFPRFKKVPLIKNLLAQTQNFLNTYSKGANTHCN